MRNTTPVKDISRTFPGLGKLHSTSLLRFPKLPTRPVCFPFQNLFPSSSLRPWTRWETCLGRGWAQVDGTGCVSCQPRCWVRVPYRVWFQHFPSLPQIVTLLFEKLRLQNHKILSISANCQAKCHCKQTVTITEVSLQSNCPPNWSVTRKWTITIEINNDKNDWNFLVIFGLPVVNRRIVTINLLNF